jgi:type IV secretory pathway VirJ component
VGNWFGGSSGGIPTPPEGLKLDAARTLCIHGRDETDSLCTQLEGKSVHGVSLPGAHHFNGDYRSVAAEILKHLATLDTRDVH